jgi:hypothetical protein
VLAIISDADRTRSEEYFVRLSIAHEPIGDERALIITLRKARKRSCCPACSPGEVDETVLVRSGLPCGPVRSATAGLAVPVSLGTIEFTHCRLSDLFSPSSLSIGYLKNSQRLLPPTYYVVWQLIPTGPVDTS